MNSAPADFANLRLLTLSSSNRYPRMISDAKRNHRLCWALQQIGVSNTYIGKNFVFHSDEKVEQVAAQMYREWLLAVTGSMVFALRLGAELAAQLSSLVDESPTSTPGVKFVKANSKNRQSVGRELT